MLVQPDRRPERVRAAIAVVKPADGIAVVERNPRGAVGIPEDEIFLELVTTRVHPYPAGGVDRERRPDDLDVRIDAGFHAPAILEGDGEVKILIARLEPAVVLPHV